MGWLFLVLVVVVVLYCIAEPLTRDPETRERDHWRRRLERRLRKYGKLD